MWVPRRLTALSPSTACYKDSFTFFLYFSGLFFSPLQNGDLHYEISLREFSPEAKSWDWLYQVSV
jgi:hypothetical protein